MSELCFTIPGLGVVTFGQLLGYSDLTEEDEFHVSSVRRMPCGRLGVKGTIDGQPSVALIDFDGNYEVAPTVPTMGGDPALN